MAPPGVGPPDRGYGLAHELLLLGFFEVQTGCSTWNQESLRWVRKGTTEVQIKEALVASPNSSEGKEQLTTSSLDAADIALNDPLRAETRKARLYLLGVSMVGITIVYTGLVPQEIATLGITFGEADRRSLLGILALVTLYFLVTFATYGVSDFIYWRRAYRNAQWSEVRQMAIEAAEMAWKNAEKLMRPVHEDRGLADEVPEEMQALGDVTKEEEKRIREEAEESIRATIRGMTVVQATAAMAAASEAMAAASEGAGVSGGSQRTSSLTPHEKAIMRYSALSPKVSSVRAVIEFLLPLLVGLYAIYVLVGPTVFGAIIAGVATVGAAWITVLAVRRRWDSKAVQAPRQETATQGTATEAASARGSKTTWRAFKRQKLADLLGRWWHPTARAREAATTQATEAARPGSLTAQRPTEEAPEEPPEEQPRDR
jgi:hypothetical protein